MRNASDIALATAKGEFNYPIDADLASEEFGLPENLYEALAEFEELVKDSQPTSNVFFTPNQAESILTSRNEANRSLGVGAREKYTNDMRNELWQPLASTIIFDDSGNLRDGQHRLRAVVNSGKGQWFKVQTHVPDAVCLQVDQGRKRRVADMLSFLGYSQSTCTKIAQSLELVYAVNRGVFGRNAHALQSITQSDKLSFAETQRNLLNRIAHFADRQSNTWVPVPALMALPLLVEPLYFEKAIQFADDLTSGRSKGDADSNANLWSPLAWLDKRMEKDHRKRPITRRGGGLGSLADKERALGMVFRAWEFYVRGEDIPAQSRGTHELARGAASKRSPNGVFNQDVFRPSFYCDLMLVDETE